MVTTLITTLWSAVVVAQAPELIWQHTIGGDSSDVCRRVLTNPDGYLVAGISQSSPTGDKTEDSQLLDYWMLQLNDTGEVVWDNSVIGLDVDHLYGLAPADDGGYYLGGYSASGFGADKTEASLGSFDYWVVKTDSIGNILWDNSIGGNSTDFLYDMVATEDGILLVGASVSGISGDKISTGFGSFDIWLLFLNEEGDIEWQRTYGGNDDDRAYAVTVSNDGGFYVTGPSWSDSSGTKSGDSRGFCDYWVLKLNAWGEQVWELTLGGDDIDESRDILALDDGGCLVGGRSISGVSGDKITLNRGDYDYWVVRLDSLGHEIWQKSYGGEDKDYLYAMEQSPGGYLIGGSSVSGISGDKTDANIGSWDHWMLRVDENGEIAWQKTVGGDSEDYIRDMLFIPETGYLIAGSSNSGISGDKTEESFGDDDFWIYLLADSCTPTTYYSDSDGDLFGDPDVDSATCTGPPTGYVLDNTDCDDNNELIYPGAFEVLNGIDDDCDGEIDEGLVSINEGPSYPLIVLAPNPGSDHLNIHFTRESVERFSISVVDMRGRVLLRNTIESPLEQVISLPTDQLAAGQYIVHVQSEQTSLYYVWSKL